MLDQLEALLALKTTGTTARAAARLRITQSAISKRIAALEATAGIPLVERVGRGCRLTTAGEALVAEAAPVLARLRDLVGGVKASGQPCLVRFAATESLLSSWLPGILRDAARASPGVALELHAHRGPVAIERVRSGDCDLAICVESGLPKDLVERRLGDEPMALAPARLDRDAVVGQQRFDAWTIEERSLTWEALRGQLQAGNRARRPDIAITGRLESFTALVQAARVGLCHALVPRGVAIAMGVSRKSLVDLPGLTRPLALVARKRTLDRPGIAQFVGAIEAAWPRPARSRRGA